MTIRRASNKQLYTLIVPFLGTLMVIAFIAAAAIAESYESDSRKSDPGSRHSAMGVSIGQAGVQAVSSAPIRTPAAATACTPVPAGLVSWYPAENNALDSIGSNDGTLRNGATFAPGEVGQGFSFDGVNDFVEVPATQTLIRARHHSP